MNPLGIVLARLDSRRLPSKPLADVCGMPLIRHVLERASRIPALGGLVVATSARDDDDALAEYLRSIGITVYRGSAENVAERCVRCAEHFSADYFVRLNGDSPFADPVLIGSGLRRLAVPRPPDLVTNLIGRTFPYGISVEIVRVAALRGILPALAADEAEHVTRRFYAQPSRFVTERIVSPRPELAHARLAVDTHEDLERCRAIVRSLGPRVHEASFEQIAEVSLDTRHAPAAQRREHRLER